MSPKGHALLSASSSDRWLHCPPSARLCESYDDKGSDYAAEGTDAHALCEYRLRQALGMEATDPTENLTWFNEEMSDCATGYATYVLEQVEAAKQTCADPVVLIEQRVDFSRWVEGGFGTADCIIIADGTLQIIDYKHGLGVLVSAMENPQMQCYGLGALELFDDIYDIDSVRMTIYQPRRDNISTYELSKDELYRWADEVLGPTADLAFAGDGNFLCGEWCGFCKAKHDCRARADANMELDTHRINVSVLIWCIVQEPKYKNAREIVHQLCDVVAKNGNLLLNVGPDTDGSFHPDAQRQLFAVGDWLAVCGEAIYASRPWKKAGEGPTGAKTGGYDVKKIARQLEEGLASDNRNGRYTSRDFRFTTRGGAYYAIALGWPEDGSWTIRSWGSNDMPGVRIVTLVGGGELAFSQGPEGLTIKAPEQMPYAYAWPLKVVCG